MFFDAIGIVIHILEAIGIGVILAGFLLATISYLRNLRRTTSDWQYREYRRISVRGLILGLEFLIAADIIKTVVVDYSLNSVLILGLVVLIRGFLVFALHLEMEGKLPWQAGDTSLGESRDNG